VEAGADIFCYKEDPLAHIYMTFLANVPYFEKTNKQTKGSL
jgi:hypothetical protein